MSLNHVSRRGEPSTPHVSQVPTHQSARMRRGLSGSRPPGFSPQNFSGFQSE